MTGFPSQCSTFNFKESALSNTVVQCLNPSVKPSMFLNQRMWWLFLVVNFDLPVQSLSSGERYHITMSHALSTRHRDWRKALSVEQD